MHFVEAEISKPTQESVFEDMCANVYGHVFDDPLPKNNGRRGQAQAGVDVFVRSKHGRVGIQCKRYQDGKLKLRHIEAEVKRAEDDGSPIVRLIVATTATNDAPLLREVQKLSDAREEAGKFPVEVEFWQEICRHIRKHPKLLLDYSPNAPGGAFEQQRQGTEKVLAAIGRVEGHLQSSLEQAVPAARSDSLNKLVSGQLDHINDLLKSIRYEDARRELSRIGADLQAFDTHQKARWYLQRGLCTWHLESGEAAAPDFLKAFELYPDDDKLAAARVRGLLLTGQASEAVAEGARLMERFPQSVHLWLAHANARIIAGDHVKLEELPAEFQDSPEALQLASIARHAAGDVAAAITTSQRALQLPDAGLYVRLTALSIALQAAMSNPVKSLHGLLEPEVSAALTKCIEAFEPWDAKLFDLQAGPAIEEGVCNLGYALLLVGDKTRGLELVKEAKRRGRVSPRLLRVEIDVLRELRDREALLELASAHIDQLEDESLLLACEVSANLGHQELVTRMKAKYEERHPGGGSFADSLRALDWIARWKAGDRDTVVSEIQGANLDADGSIELILAGARILRESGDGSQASAAVERAARLLKPESHQFDRITVADLLFESGEFSRAAALYKEFATPGKLSDLHTRLLECYLRSGEPRKAKQVLEAFPAGWIDNDAARGLAIQLGQTVGDWNFLEPLADVQRERHPSRASSWLFSLSVASHAGKMHRFHELLKQLPQRLEGSLEQVGQLARTEIHFGEAASGQNRLYRAFRESLDDAEAAAQYMVGMVAASEPLPNMEDAVKQVGPGTSVLLVDENGAETRFTLDPSGVGSLPLRTEFIDPSSPDAAALLGKAVDDVVELAGSMGRSRRFTAKSVTSSYRRLVHVAQETMARSLKAPKNVLQMSIRHTSEGADFSEMKEMLQQQTQHSKLALDGYENSPITLSILAKLLGVNVIDLVVGWPASESLPLFTCRGTVEELKEADELLSRKDGAYVVDAATLAEFVNFDCEAALAVLPKMYAATETRDALRARLEEARRDRSEGRAVDAGGELGYLPNSDTAKARRVAFFERMVRALEEFCEVVPAYGPETLPDEFRKFREVLESEEYSALVLAAEKRCTLLTVDERLSNLGKATLGLSRVWPHAVIAAANGADVISDAVASDAALKMFVSNRSFTPLRATDLVDLCHYGGPFMQTGLQRYKACCSSPSTNIEAIVNVTLEFLAVLPTRAISLAAYGELVEHLCEATLRHPQCDTQAVVDALAHVLGDVVDGSETALGLFPPLQAIRTARLKHKGAFLTQAIRRGIEYANKEEAKRRVRLKVLKCTRRPAISLDKVVDGVPAEATQTVEASHIKENPSTSTAILAVNTSHVGPQFRVESDAAADEK